MYNYAYTYDMRYTRNDFFPPVIPPVTIRTSIICVSQSGSNTERALVHGKLFARCNFYEKLLALTVFAINFLRGFLPCRFQYFWTLNNDMYIPDHVHVALSMQHLAGKWFVKYAKMASNRFGHARERITYNGITVVDFVAHDT